MTQYNSLNVTLPNSQLNKLKPGMKNGTEVFLNLSLNVIGDSNNDINFPYKLLLDNRQISWLRKAFFKVIYQLIWNYRNLNSLIWYS